MQEPSTRLIIKNIPKHVDERRLKQHFAERGEVSDAKVVRTKDGRSRLFAFVGFTSENDATEALKYYNRTFLDTSRIQVERAQPKGDAGIARPWSKHSQGSSRAQKLAEAKTKREGRAKEKKEKKDFHDARSSLSKDNTAENREKQEFIASLKKRSEARFWDNDDTFLEDATADVDKTEGLSSDEDMGSSVDGGEGAQAVELASGGKPPRKGQGKIGVSDMDWLRSKVGGKSEVDEEASENESKASSESSSARGAGERDGELRRHAPSGPEDRVNARAQSSPADSGVGGESGEGNDEGEEEEESGLSVGRLFVRNLPYTSTEDDLRELFEAHGLLSEVHLPVDDVKKGKGFAFVQFVIPDDARKAMERLDRHAFHGRLLHIIPARRQPGTSGAEVSDSTASGAGTNYKKKKEEDRRARAGDSAGWNASFMRSDTVVDALADRLGVGKSDILDREEGDMAVRLAVGETHLVKENKEYFEKEGVDLSVLESSKGKGRGKGAEERSRTVILVKNLPYSTDAAELAKRFGAFGDVGRVLLPPSKAVALVEFLVAADARNAFKRLAYTRFQHVPLYLEWAPVKAFGESFSPSSKPAALPASEKSVTGEEAKVDDDEVAAGRASNEPLTTFVKNLSFSTTEAGLRSCFEKGGLRVRSVSIPRKKGKGASEATLSMGFGFVECVDAAVAEKALKTLQGTILDGHALELKRSTKRLTKAAPKSDEVKRSKLIIRNVPFQTTAKEIRELLASFGQLKRVRLPKKFDGNHRGFAFVDYLTSQDAQNAKMSLDSTHFYGRHLVGEWAEDKEDVETLRAKAARDVRGSAEGGRSAKRQKSGGGDDFEDMD